MNKLTAITPFYNEGKQISSVIDSLQEVPDIDQIIAVDDGSTDETFKLIQEKFPKVELVRLHKNSGKAKAVKTGLEKARNTHILMIDADLSNIDSSELEQAIKKYFDLNIDVLVFKVGGGNNWLDRRLRKEILFSGFRILKKIDLERVFDLYHPSGYQLEVAINEYMLRQNKTIRWTSTSARNIHKSNKWGYLNGLLRSTKMEWSILRYLGLKNASLQVRKFGKTSL